jgi:hypothetical protein
LKVLQEGRPQKKTKIIGDDAAGVRSQSRTHGDVTAQSSVMTTLVKRKKVYPARTTKILQGSKLLASQ